MKDDEDSGSKLEPGIKSSLITAWLLGTVGTLGIVSIVSIVAIVIISLSTNEDPYKCQIIHKEELPDSQLKTLKGDIEDIKSTLKNFESFIKELKENKKNTVPNYGKKVSESDNQTEEIIKGIEIDPIIIESAKAHVDELGNECYDTGYLQAQQKFALLITKGCETRSNEFVYGYLMGWSEDEEVAIPPESKETPSTSTKKVEQKQSDETKTEEKPKPSCDEIACSVGASDKDYNFDQSKIPETCEINIFMEKVESCRQRLRAGEDIVVVPLTGIDLEELISNEVIPDENSIITTIVDLTDEEKDDIINTGDSDNYSVIKIVKQTIF